MAEEEGVLARGVEGMDVDWRDVRRLVESFNIIVLGYQAAIGSVLGKGFTGLTQVLIGEIGDVLSDMVDRVLGGGTFSGGEDVMADAVKASLEATGIARDVSVDVMPEEVRGRIRLRRYRVRIRDSLFRPVYSVLAERGYREFPLSPEGLLVAAVARRVLGEAMKGTKMNMRARLVEGGEELEIVIEQVAVST